MNLDFIFWNKVKLFEPPVWIEFCSQKLQIFHWHHGHHHTVGYHLSSLRETAGDVQSVSFSGGAATTITSNPIDLYSKYKYIQSVHTLYIVCIHKQYIIQATWRACYNHQLCGKSCHKTNAWLTSSYIQLETKAKATHMWGYNEDAEQMEA